MNLTGFFDVCDKEFCDIETNGRRGREWGNDGFEGIALDGSAGGFRDDAARGEEMYGMGDDVLRAGCTADMVIAAERDL
jgi:hypothetical protein